MAYNKESIFNQALDSIKEEKNIFFVDDLVAYVSCSRSTFYEMFPADSDELDALKGLLSENKIAMKVKLRNKLAKGDKAAEIISLYKLIATDDERRALSMQHIDHTTKGEKINIVSLGDGTEPDETTS